MLVFRAQYVAFGFMRPHSCDVDEQPSLIVNPPRVNNIQIVLVRRIGVSRIDFQHVISFPVGMDRHVVVLRQEIDRVVCHLDINVGVPWQYLSQSERTFDATAHSLTLRFHHQPSNVPCIIHVSAPRSAIDARYDCMSSVRLLFCSS